MIATLYTHLPTDLKQQLEHAIDQGLSNGKGEAEVFFRADDFGVPSKQSNQLIHLFKKTKIPLCLAVVPSWLTPVRYKKLLEITGTPNSQWCFHQHGWLHKNHEPTGKKQEFGPARAKTEQKQDLKKGKERLISIMGKTFSPFFTPPWNRCSQDTLHSLMELQFRGISRSLNAKPISPQGLPDIAINTDLHTRKERTAEESLQNLLNELTRGLAAGRSGIMLHHQRMNQTAFDFLAILLTIIDAHPHLYPVTFQDMF